MNKKNYRDLYKTFENFIPQSKIKKANEALNKTSLTPEGQLHIINLAKEGDENAFYFLWNKYKGITYNIFKNYLATYIPQGLEEEYFNDFLVRASSLLLGKSMDLYSDVDELKGPHKTWNSSAYDKQSPDNYIRAFGYYYRQYLMSEAKKIQIIIKKNEESNSIADLANDVIDIDNITLKDEFNMVERNENYFNKFGRYRKLFENASEDFMTPSGHTYRNGVAYINEFVPRRDLKRAKDKYEGVENNQQEQLKLLEDAKNGKDLAVYYLYDRYKGLTAKIYSKFLGWSDHQDPQIVEEFVSRSFQILSGGRDIDDEGNIIITGPHKTWKPDVYTDITSSSNYLNYFGFYYMSYLREEAKKMYRHILKKGGTGTVDAVDSEIFGDDNSEEAVVDPSKNKMAPSVVSYDAFFSNDNEVATQDFSGDVIADTTLKDFEKWLLDHHGINFYKVFIGIKNGVPVKDIAKSLNFKNPQAVRNYADKLTTWAKEFFGVIQSDTINTTRKIRAPRTQAIEETPINPASDPTDDFEITPTDADDELV